MTCEGKKLLCYSFPYVMWTVLCLFVFWSYCADCTVLPAAAATKAEPACWQADDSVFPQNPSKRELRITTAASTPSIHTQTRLHTETHRYTWTHLRRSSRTDKHRGDTGLWYYSCDSSYRNAQGNLVQQPAGAYVGPFHHTPTDDLVVSVR